MESVSQVAKHVAGQHAAGRDLDASCHSKSEHSQIAAMTPVEIEEIGKRESKAVFWSRIAVLAVLVAAAVGVALVVFFYMSGSETDQFETQYNSDALKVLEAVGKSLDSTLGATDAFIVKLVAYSRYSNSTWPFVTMPDFGIQATKLLRLSKALTLGVNHLVKPDQRDAWQKYASENDGWIDESVEIQANDEDWHGPIIRDYNTSYEMYGFAGPVQEPLPYMDNYAPVWQSAPMAPIGGSFPYNMDAWQIPNHAKAINHSYATQRVVISQDFGGIITDPDDPVQVMVANNGWRWASNYVKPGEDVHAPVSVIVYPVVDAMDSVRIDVNKKQPIVATLFSIIFWRELFQDILPPNSNGVLVVVEHTCGKGQAFTYQLDGPKPIFLGVGDQHDPKYDYLGYSVLLSDLMDTTKFDRDSDYTGLPLAEDYCPKTLKVFPSQLMEDEYKTSDPLIFTFAAALIFVFTSIVFVTYDLLVARRQRIVLNRAMASGAIVSSLFPQKVREQLYQDAKKETQEKSGMNTFFTRNEGAIEEKVTPNASLYEETTIFFADLVGFTAWSSKRTPIEVFELLETLYSAFDAIAAKRGVFKVETIGDCYVAATGIPEPQADHAVILVKFGQDCMTQFSQLTHDLVASLGADTAELDMRVGLHSGATTAGVLRGAKGRFQLFGDTVNTAARMESNGVRGRIHVSQATADALIIKGKSHWLINREDKVVAKGKGEMQTYFIAAVKSDKSVFTTGSSDDGESVFTTGLSDEEEINSSSGRTLY